ncbi:acyl carrier protein [Deltaproteobacteria bacterium TL4]
MEQLQEEIKAILASLFGVSADEITPDANFVDDLGADSMDALEIIMRMEDKYQITVDQGCLPEMTNLRKVTTLVQSLLQAK